MNARQKAKKYKRMYEALLKSPVKFKVEQHKIDTLRFERFYPEPLIAQKNSSYLQEIMAKDIAKGIIESGLGEYIDYHIEFCPHINMYRFCGEIKIVNNRFHELEEDLASILKKSHLPKDCHLFTMESEETK